MKITPRQLDEFFESHKAKNICPFCQSTSWTIPVFDTEKQVNFSPDDLMNAAVTLVHATDQVTHVTYSSENLALTCSNCGFVRLQSLSVLKTWMEEKGYTHE